MLVQFESPLQAYAFVWLAVIVLLLVTCFIICAFSVICSESLDLFLSFIRRRRAAAAASAFLAPGVPVPAEVAPDGYCYASDGSLITCEENWRRYWGMNPRENYRG